MLSPRSNRALVFLLLSAAPWGCLLPTPGAPEDALLADRQRIEAMIRADADGLDRWLHTSLSYAHSDGRVDSKSGLIENLVTGRVNYVTIEPLSPRARLFGGVAIVTAKVGMQVIAAGQTHRLKSIYTAVYCFEDARWQLVAYHSSPVVSR